MLVREELKSMFSPFEHEYRWESRLIDVSNINMEFLLD
jgi:hypothetical protein